MDEKERKEAIKALVILMARKGFKTPVRTHGVPTLEGEGATTPVHTPENTPRRKTSRTK